MCGSTYTVWDLRVSDDYRHIYFWICASLSVCFTNLQVLHEYTMVEICCMVWNDWKHSHLGNE